MEPWALKNNWVFHQYCREQSRDSHSCGLSGTAALKQNPLHFLCPGFTFLFFLNLHRFFGFPIFCLITVTTFIFLAVHCPAHYCAQHNRVRQNGVASSVSFLPLMSAHAYASDVHTHSVSTLAFHPFNFTGLFLA
jgi:hypothetical protein